MIELQELNDGIPNVMAEGINDTSGPDAELFSHGTADTLYRLFIDKMSQGVAMLDADGTILYCNNQFAKILCVPYEKINGTPYNQFFTGLANLNLDQFLNGDKEIRHDEEILYIATGGESRYLDLSLFSLDLSGLSHICIIISDIAGIRFTEEKIREMYNRLELALESANMAWWEMNISTGKVIFHKRKAEMLGFRPGKFNHYSDFVALVHPDDRYKLMDNMRNHLSGLNANYEGEYRILDINGNYHWFYDIGKVNHSDSDGKPVTVTGIVFDISERKKLSAEMERSEARYRTIFENIQDLFGKFPWTERFWK